MRPDSFDPPTLKRRLRPKTHRVALRLAYDGGGFHGFQRQPGFRTVEGELLLALSELGLSTALSFASRTDSGVHAEGQVAVVRAPAGLEPDALAASLASRLPSDLRLTLARPAPEKFHPRWQAVGKKYRYAVSRTPEPRAWHLPQLDRSRFVAALQQLARATKLDGLTAAGGKVGPAPPLERLAIREEENRLVVELEGPAFRRYAIRHLVGAAVACARGDIELESLVPLAEGAPPYRGLRAPADGLVLESVRYPPGRDPFA